MGTISTPQTNITTDDELQSFLEKPGLIVLEVYSGWCGPCIAMVNNLKQIKSESNGDSLHIASCLSDGINVLSRFKNKSEPTWLFIINGKVFNIEFGTNAPHLKKVIQNELKLLKQKHRVTYTLETTLPKERLQRERSHRVLKEILRKEETLSERAKYVVLPPPGKLEAEIRTVFKPMRKMETRTSTSHRSRHKKKRDRD